MPWASASADSALTSMLSDCPPSKPISIRTWSAMRHHLRENAVDGIRMDERDLETEQPLVRLLVDELCPFALQRLERRVDVRDLERHVMHAGPALREEPAHGAVLLERAQELDTTRADEHGRRLDALLRHGRAVLELGAEQPLVGAERLVEVLDR